jgi:hypothetical protein
MATNELDEHIVQGGRRARENEVARQEDMCRRGKAPGHVARPEGTYSKSFAAPMGCLERRPKGRRARASARARPERAAHMRVENDRTRLPNSTSQDDVLESSTIWLLVSCF